MEYVAALGIALAGILGSVGLMASAVRGTCPRPARVRA